MAIKIRNGARGIHVTIDGEELDALERAALAMNRISWGDKDPPNTAFTVFRAFVWPWAGQFLEDPSQMAMDILDGIATDDDGMTSAPEPVHSQRLAELRAAFEAEGLLEKGGEA
jgi:hypothetical protein